MSDPCTASTDVVELMVRLTDGVVRTRLDHADGLGSAGVRVIDPGAATGTFYDRVAVGGEGAARETVADLATRLYGFARPLIRLRVDDAPAKLGVEPSRQARRVKTEVPVTVMIGNPPYRERAGDDGEWAAPGVERRRRNLTDGVSLKGNSHVEYVLHNLAWYLWRWGVWQVLDQHEGPQHHGVVTYVTTTTHLRGPRYAGMRRYLRRTCDEGWIIDLTPEGCVGYVAVDSRVFPAVRQPLAIGIFVRRSPHTPNTEPARIRYRSVHGGRAGRYAALAAIDLDDDGWADTRTTPDTAPFTPAR